MFERILNILLVLALGVIIGSVFFFGLGVAGVLFNPELLPTRTLAGGLNAEVLRRLMVLVTGASIVALGSSIPLMFSRPRRTTVVLFACLVLLVPLSLYLSLVLFPEADALRVAIGSFDPVLAAKEDLHTTFTDLHGRFSLLTRIAFGLALIGLVAHLLSLVSAAARGREDVAKDRGTKSGGAGNPKDSGQRPAEVGTARPVTVASKAERAEG